MKHTTKRCMALLLATILMFGLLPVTVLAAGENGPALPTGNMWVYVSNHGKWGVGTESHALKLYKLVDQDAVSGSAATEIESGGIYIIGDTEPVGSTNKYRKMYAQAAATDSCGEDAVPGDPYTLTNGCLEHKTNHMFRLTVDESGWYTIQSVDNSKYLDIGSVTVGSYNQINLTTTPTKFAVVSTGESGMFTIAAAVVDPDAPPDLEDLTEPLYGAIVDDDLQYVQANFSAALAADAKSATLNAWRNDAAISQIFLATGKTAQTGVVATAGAFSDGNGNTIAAENVDLSFIKVVQAYTGMNGWGDSHGVAVPEGSRKDAAEVLMGDAPVNMEAGKVQGLWVTVNVPKDAEPGTYQGEVTVTASGLTDAQKLTFTYTLNVASPVLPNATEFKDGFDIELWQNPYASAEYYDVTPFSEAHFAILTPIMEKYRDIGGHAITTTIAEDAWARQTYSQNEVHIPSMVAWSKNAAGKWVFDYTDFDAWIRFNIDEIGIGDKIVCYSTAPWTNEIRYLDNSGAQQVISKSDTAAWNEGWTAFLTDLMAHMEANGWKERTYIGIDERGIDDAALTLIESVKGTDGKSFKKAGAMDSMDASHQALAIRIDDLNVGSMAIKGSRSNFDSMLAARKETGLRTTVYSCTGHKPGNFSLSAPGESYWTMLYSYSVGGTGFLRWAYDSWVADPLRDTSHAKFEAGDCFLIFPDEKTAQNPVIHSSLRLEKMAQGVRDVNKLMIIKGNCPAMESAVATLAATVRPTYDSSGYYLTDAGKTALANDMKALRQGIVTLTAEYEERLATGDTKKLNLQPQDVPLVNLPEQYQGDVYGPILDASKQYYGQPDTITLTDGTLVTAFPQGHGCGPLLLMKSDNRGESWEQIKDTPASWENSLETPTMYRLNFTDGSVKYVLIAGRPQWHHNVGASASGGWDVSISDDGIHWSEYTQYQRDSGLYSVVAMASLVQLKDQNGNFIDKWMGVCHDLGYNNYKTYLTFDEQGNMQWSAPERYLQEYDSVEKAKQICEVGMFRSPDGNRIMALARTQAHNCMSVMFWSDDEGETWSKPVEMQGALYGERHKALYDPVSGRLVITFREMICESVTANGGFGNWTCGEWMAWVGTYEDLMERNEGQYRIRLDYDWAPSTKSGDTGYTGMAVYPDGTFVLDTYGHWDQDFSQTQSNVTMDRCWIRRAKFTLADIDALYKHQLETEIPTEELNAAVLAKNAKANSWMESASGADGGPAWAFDNAVHWWHGNYGTATDENINGQNPSEEKPIWIQTGFDEEREIVAVSYQPRSSNGCIINAYELQFACLGDPTAQPADADFTTVKSGNLQNTTATQTITLDEPVAATHMRLVAVGPVQGGNSYPTAQRIRIYAVGEAAHRSDAATLTSLSVGGQSVAVSGTDTNLGVLTVSGNTADLRATVSDKAKCNVLVNSYPVAKDEEGNVKIALAQDVTLVKLHVAAEDTVTTKDYSLALVKENDANAQLRALSLGSMKLYPAFDPAVTEYYAVNYGNRTAGLTAVAAQTGAGLSFEAVADAGDGTGALNGAVCRFFKSENETAAGGKLYTQDGKLYNKVAVTVTSPDGRNTATYTVHVEVRESAYLSDLGWSAIVGNTPIRDRAWGYNALSLIGENGSEIISDSHKGLGVRANTVVEYDLSDTGFDTLSGRVGVSYAQRSSANTPELQFRVILDGEEAMLLSSTKDAAAPEAFTVNLDTARKLALRTTAVGTSVTDADGNWTDVKLSTIIPLLENLDAKPITALAFGEGETHTIYVNENDPDHTVTLRPQVTPVDSPELLVWESDNAAVATVSDGVVTAVAPGMVTITVSNQAGDISATCSVTVKRTIEGSVAIDADGDGEVRLGSMLTANVNNIVSEFKQAGLNYTWSVSDTEDGEGTVISGADTDQFTVPMDKEYVGKFIAVTVTPKGQYHEGEATAVTAAVKKAVGPALQAVPTFENASDEEVEDGAITGLFLGRAYEYQKVANATDPVDETRWTPFSPEGDDSGVTGTFGNARIENLGVGTYIIRRAETDIHEAGPHRTVTIAVRGAANVVVNNPQTFEGGRVTVGRTQIPAGDAVRLTVTPETGYELEPDSLKATADDGSEIVADATSTEGLYTFTMPNGITDVTISAVFRRKTYVIEHDLTHITCSLGAEENHTATHGEEFTITLTPDEGYAMPVRITVTNTDTGAAFTDFTYRTDASDPNAMVVTFRNGVICNITISGAAVPRTYTAVYHLTNGVTAPGAPQTATHFADFTATISAARGYALPDSITVTVGGEELADTDYKYDAESGELTIPGERVTGNVDITATGEASALTLQTIAMVGPARVGRKLTVNTVPVNATVEYQWIMVDENGAETELEGATGQEYTIPAEAVGKQIKVRVTGTGSYEGTLTSEPTAAILSAAEPFIFVDQVAVAPQDASVPVGSSLRLNAVATPDDATSPILFWSSSNEAIATVDQNGVVRGVAEGAATITAVSTDRMDNVSASCRVTVTPKTSTGSSSRPSAPSTTTTYETREDGSKVTTVTKPDGSKTVTVEQPDGTKSETVTTKDGNVTITVTDENGEELVKAEIPATIVVPETRFEDVSETHWANEAIHNIAALKLVNGTGENKYSPVAPMTRGSLATVLHRLSQGKTDYEVTFQDVAQGKYYTEGVAWAAKAKVVTGYTADIFAPDDIITREQLAVMMARYAKLVGLDTKADAKALDQFVDGDTTGTWAVDGVAWCVQNGILKGKGNDTLDPTAEVTRAEVAVMLDRFIALIRK